jgi:hypothetical protein
VRRHCSSVLFLFIFNARKGNFYCEEGIKEQRTRPVQPDEKTRGEITA